MQRATNELSEAKPLLTDLSFEHDRPVADAVLRLSAPPLAIQAVGQAHMAHQEADQGAPYSAP